MASWGFPHEMDGICQRVNRIPCDPGMKGCVLYGRFVFSNPAKNRPAKPDSRDTAQGNAERPYQGADANQDRTHKLRTKVPPDYSS